MSKLILCSLCGMVLRQPPSRFLSLTGIEESFGNDWRRIGQILTQADRGRTFAQKSEPSYKVAGSARPIIYL